MSTNQPRHPSRSGIFTDLVPDIRFGLRNLVRRPGFTLIVVLTLAIGIGATTAMYSTIDAVLLSKLRYEAPDRLVLGRGTDGDGLIPQVSGYDYYDYREQSKSFESLAALSNFTIPITILGESEPERATGTLVTWDLLQTLGVDPVAGRLFTEEEAVAGNDSVLLISHSYWQSRFGGSPEAIGSTLSLSLGGPHTVVGVLPAGFHFLRESDIWRLTYRDGPAANARRFHNFVVVGRLKPDVNLRQAQSEMDGISERLEELYPETNENKALLLTGLHEALVENVRRSLLMLMAAAALVLLLACGNASSLLLARGQSRTSEIAVRSAMGASRWRLVRLLLTESMMMALGAGIVGLGLAHLFQGLLTRLLPMGRLGIDRPPIDTPVLVFTLAVSVVTGIIFAVIPALRASAIELSEHLSAGGRRTTSDRRTTHLRNAIVVLQVAASVVLLIGAGLLMRSLANQMEVDLGFEATNLLTAEVELPEEDYPEPAQRIAFFTSLAEEVQALPGVEGVGLVNRLPIRDSAGDTYIHPVGQPPESRDNRISADFRLMLPGYFATMEIPLLAGRDITASDGPRSEPVMILSDSLSRALFSDQDPIGQEVVVDAGRPITLRVIGVAADARLNSVRSSPRHSMYASYPQLPMERMKLAVRTAGPPTESIGPIREILARKDHNIPLAEPASMESIIDDAIADSRIVTLSLGVFSAIALLLALVGLYGVLSYFVNDRHQEIGVRMALGASARQVVRFVLSRAMVLVATGLIFGLVGSYWVSRLIQRLLFEVEAADPSTLIAVTLSFAMVALVTCSLPAWRASRVDPASALQAE